MRGDGQGRKGQKSLATTQGVRGQGRGAVLEGDGAGGGAAAWRSGADGGGESDGLAKHGRVDGGGHGGGRVGRVDGLAERRGGAVAAVEVAAAVIDGGDGMRSDRQSGGGVSGRTGAEVDGGGHGGGRVGRVDGLAERRGGAEPDR